MLGQVPKHESTNGLEDRQQSYMYTAFLRHMELQQAVNRAIVFEGLFFDLIQQVEAVHRMNEVCERSDVFHFVALQMPDEVPADVFGQGLVFWQEFLHAVFAEVALPLMVEFENGLCRLGFRDGHQLYISDFQFV